MNLLKIRINGVEKLVKYEPYESIKIDGRKYRIVQIGRQWWMAENLDYAWEGLPTTGGHSDYTAYAMYPDNNETMYGYDGKRYGLMYNFRAMRYLVSNTSAFPENWHVPTQAELTKLVNAAGGDSVAGGKLKSSTKYDGTDDYGFSMVPAGLYYNGTAYDSLENNGYLWAEEEYSSYSGYTKKFVRGSDSVTFDDPSKPAFNSIRLCKDATVSIGGKDYPTTRIGNQVWLAENLDYKWDGLDTSSNVPYNSTGCHGIYYYFSEPTYGWNGYRCGILYNHYAKEALKELLPTIAPGWRIATIADIDTLNQYVNAANVGYRLSSTVSYSSYWTGSDQYGMNLKPNGAYAYDGNSSMIFIFLDRAWYIHLSESHYLARRYMEYESGNPVTVHTWSGYPLYGIRLVKDIK